MLSLAAASKEGAVVSSMVKVAVVVLVFKQSSVAVKVTKAEPVAPHSSLKAVKSLDHITPPQRSEAAAPPLEANQAFSSAVFPAPSHSTVSSTATVSIVGSVVSSMVKVAVVVLANPHSSVAVKITVCEPVAPHSSLKF